MTSFPLPGACRRVRDDQLPPRPDEPLAALRRADLGADLGAVTVRSTLVQFTDGRFMFGQVLPIS